MAGSYYQRKTADEYVIQQCFDTGWEDVTTEDNKQDAYQRLREYRANQPEYPVRFIKRRVRLTPKQPAQ